MKHYFHNIVFTMAQLYTYLQIKSHFK